MVQPINDWSHNNTKSLVGAATPAKSLFKCEDDKNNYYWPAHGVQLGDTVYIYCPELGTTHKDGKQWFANTGNDHWCKMDVKTLKVTGYQKLQPFDGIIFGQGVIDIGDDHIYVYGTKGKVVQGKVTPEIFLALYPSQI